MFGLALIYDVLTSCTRSSYTHRTRWKNPERVKITENLVGYARKGVTNHSARWTIQKSSRMATLWQHNMSRNMTKPTKWPVRQAKTQISLSIRPIYKSELCTPWVAKYPSFLHVDSEDSDQPRCTGHFIGIVMMWLIWKQTGKAAGRFIRSLSCSKLPYLIL